jgi:hypothetical protein
VGKKAFGESFHGWTYRMWGRLYVATWADRWFDSVGT